MEQLIKVDYLDNDGAGIKISISDGCPVISLYNPGTTTMFRFKCDEELNRFIDDLEFARVTCFCDNK